MTCSLLDHLVFKMKQGVFTEARCLQDFYLVALIAKKKGGVIELKTGY
ncbi:hypothetical protein GDO86_002149 [Hymenochirus boettgeri]|uniref:Uncharacterized protein n=1 Tax=Hymenochirus boettgeri TaxID=247094 RepID=A0A8T2KNU7_9PIPI|nr:hypothetical protein GDO86_002149 [Hymenochirus boettgeri]